MFYAERLVWQDIYCTHTITVKCHLLTTIPPFSQDKNLLTFHPLSLQPMEENTKPTTVSVQTVSICQYITKCMFKQSLVASKTVQSSSVAFLL